MKTIVAGTREGISAADVYMILTEHWSKYTITEVVVGGARGVDSYAEEWARLNDLVVKRFDADWDRFGKRAGPIRNSEMAGYGQCLIAIWDGKSKGTGDMIRKVKSKGLPLFIHEI